MIEYKKVPFITCDLCGKDEGEVSIQSWNMLSGLGYAPSNTDPLAQKFKKLYKKVDICDSCRARMDHNYLGLSPEEREQIVYANIAVHDNRKDLRVDPRHGYGIPHPKFKAWLSMKSLLHEEDIKRAVEEAIKPKHLSIQLWKEGKWEAFD